MCLTSEGQCPPLFLQPELLVQKKGCMYEMPQLNDHFGNRCSCSLKRTVSIVTKWWLNLYHRESKTKIYLLLNLRESCLELVLVGMKMRRK
jgi:hypothetical protein